MSLLVDNKFLLHSMRIKYLRIEDRIGDRVISFSPTVMSNDYIKTAAPIFPEMQYCYSPTYNTQDNYLSQSKKIPLGGLSSGTTLASESATSSIYTMSSGKAKSLAFTKRGEPSGRKAVQIALPRISRSEEEQQQGDSEDDIDYEGESHSGGRSRSPMYDIKSPGEGPTLLVQPPSKPPTIGTDDFDGESFSPDSDMNRMVSSHGGSQLQATPSTLASNHSNGPRTPASLDPSVDSTPSPYTSPDVGSNSLEGIRLNMRNEHTPPVLLPTNVAAQNPGPGILLNPTTRESQSQAPSANSIQLRTRILDNSQPSPLSMVRSPLVAGGRSGAPSRAKSNLTALIHEKQSTVDNPFAEEYSFFAGKGEPNPMNMIVYLPFSLKSKEPMKVAVKRDTMVEDVIGYILYQYVEERRLPYLESEKCDVTKWVLRMAEDDGEVDEDIPPFDRMHKINKISFDEFALCEATVAQQKVNQQTHEKILKSRPKREKPATLLSTTASPSPVNPTIPTQPVTPTSPTPNTHQQQQIEALPPSASAIPVPTAKNTLTKSALTNPAYQYLKVRLEEEKEVSATTLLSVYADMFVGDVLEMVCRKKRLDPKLYVLKVADKDVIIPLDRTMESLHEVEEMALVKKSDSVPSNSGGTIWRNNRNRKKDNSSEVLPPSASTDSETPNEYMGQYKKYIVNRKSNMLVGRHERVLAIDGDYIHLMPPEQKGMFERMKTSSYHISQVHSCRQAKKTQNFKLVVLKDREQKAYELEAETPKDAHEICDKIFFLQQVNKGSQVRI